MFLETVSDFLPFLGLPMVHLFEMSAQVTALGEILVAKLTCEGPLSCVFSEVVPQVARLFENATTVWIHAFEEKLLSLGLGVLDLYGLVPFAWNTFEVLGHLLRLRSLVLTGVFLELGFLRRKHLLLFLLNELGEQIFKLCHVMLHFRLLVSWLCVLDVDVFDLGGSFQFAQKLDQVQLLLKIFVLVEIVGDARHSFVQTASRQVGKLLDNLRCWHLVHVSVILDQDSGLLHNHPLRSQHRRSAVWKAVRRAPTWGHQ